MKKIMTLFAAAVIAGAAWAHTTSRVMPINRALPEKQAATMQFNVEAATQHQPVANTTMGFVAAKDFAAREYNSMAQFGRRATMDVTPLRAGYLNPTGSYFCGIDKFGTYFFTNYITVVGSWLNGYDAWVWPNISTGSTEVQYLNAFGAKDPKYMDKGNTMDAEGNWVDSLPIMYKGDPNYMYSFRVPAQIVTNGEQKDTFVINQTYSGRMDTLISEMITVGGAYNTIFPGDGMWPLTKAMFMDKEYGFTMNNLWNIDTVTNTPEYIFGSSKVTRTVKSSQGEDSTVVYVPAILMQAYEAPMSPMYVHDITLAIGACEYNAQTGKYKNCAPTFDTLAIAIMNLAGTKAFFAGIATIEDTTNMMYIPGALVNFKIETEDEFGEKKIGVVLDEPFMVMIMGLNNPGNNFGIYAGMNLLTGGQTAIMDANSPKYYQYYPGDPFIMFNGIMATLEDASIIMGYEPMGDTINIEVVESQGEWIGIYADGDMKGYVPMIAATDLLYDTLTQLYNYEINAPEWAEFDMEYTSKDFDMWGDYSMYALYIFGDASDPDVEAPKVGDQITFTQYGCSIVYNVVAAPSTGLNAVKYINDNKRYDVLGKEVDENYKGVVIINGKKMIQ